MLSVAVAEESDRSTYLARWLRVLSPETESRIPTLVSREGARLTDLLASLRDAEVVVVTVGNTLDFFLSSAEAQSDGDFSVAPKFLALFKDEDMTKRSSYGKRLRDAGAVFRMATYGEALGALRTLHSVIRKLNPKAFCIFTLSPVPIGSAFGLETGLPGGAIEIDTIGKSTLRAALAELFGELKTTDPNTHTTSLRSRSSDGLAPPLTAPCSGTRTLPQDTCPQTCCRLCIRSSCVNMRRVRGGHKRTAA